MRKILLVIILAGLFFSIVADNEFSGFADTFNAVSFRQGDMTASRTRFRGKFISYKDNLSMFASVNAESNGVSDNTSIKLHEAYIEIQIKDYNFKAGKQLITWGNSDGFRLTDMICPLDMTEFVTQDFDDTRIPVNSISLSMMQGPAEIQIIGLPVFTTAEFPDNNSPWFYIPKNMKGMDVIQLEPAQKLENSEAAVKASFYFAQIDFALSGLYVWTDSPLYLFNGNELNAVYKRQKVLGIESSCTMGKFVMRSESSIHFDEYLEKENYDGFNKKHIMKSLSGIDWYPGNDWAVSGQVYSETILSYSRELNKDEFDATLTFNVEKKLMNQMLDISAMTYYNINKKDMYNKVLITYDLSDNISAEIGADIFSGEDGTYTNQSDNSQVRTKLKYSF